LPIFIRDVIRTAKESLGNIEITVLALKILYLIVVASCEIKTLPTAIRRLHAALLEKSVPIVYNARIAKMSLDSNTHLAVPKYLSFCVRKPIVVTCRSQVRTNTTADS
jgi:hypothetical protein